MASLMEAGRMRSLHPNFARSPVDSHTGTPNLSKQSVQQNAYRFQSQFSGCSNGSPSQSINHSPKPANLVCKTEFHGSQLSNKQRTVFTKSCAGKHSSIGRDLDLQAALAPEKLEETAGQKVIENEALPREASQAEKPTSKTNGVQGGGRDKAQTRAPRGLGRNQGPKSSVARSADRTPTALEQMASISGFLKSDGGPPRWFCPLDARPTLGEPGSAKDPLPRMFFLPGIDGSGLGMVLQHKPLSRLFNLECLHIPAADRTPFDRLVELVGARLRAEHEEDSRRAMFVIGESFGAMLALAVAARNSKLPLRLVLINPATSFQRSQLQPFLPLLRSFPSALYRGLPILLSFTMGDPVRMAAAGIPVGANPIERAALLRDNLLLMLPELPMIADILPQATLQWKLEELAVGSRYMEAVLECVRAPSLILASGKDNMLPSKEESRRLKKVLPNCTVRDLPESGHAPLLEEGIDVASYIKATGFYRRTTGPEDPITNFVGPSPEDIERAREGLLKVLRQLSSPVSFSTLDDGTIVQGFEGIPAGERPLLFIGNHQTFAPDLGIVVDEILRGTGVLPRGLAHPFAMGAVPRGEDSESATGNPLEDFFRTFGAVPVSGSSMYKLMATNQAALLFPGGVREAYRRKGEEYKLFWPDRPEFVRMAVRHGATIIPYAAVGVDDGLQILLDSEEITNLPIVGERILASVQKLPKARAEGTAGPAEELFIAPVIAPGSPKRFYFLFRKPIRTKELKEVMDDKEKTMELYLQVKSEVEAGLDYLLEKREEDPYKELGPRLLYEASWGGERQAPTFTP